jgi:RNA polymerase sigma factor (sigma-70 family)
MAVPRASAAWVSPAVATGTSGPDAVEEEFHPTMSGQTQRDSSDHPPDQEDAGAAFRKIQAYLERLRQRGTADSTGDEEWDQFARLYARHFLELVRGRHWSEADRDDGMQELWLLLITRLPDLHYDPDRGDLRDWIAATARHRLVDRERCRRRHPLKRLDAGTAERLAGREPDPAAAFERKRLRELVWDALAELRTMVRPRDYAAFVLHWIRGLRVAEIAQGLGMTEGQVWSSHHRTLQKLRPLLARRLGLSPST